MNHKSPLRTTFPLLFLTAGIASGTEQLPDADTYEATPPLTKENYRSPEKVLELNRQQQAKSQCWFCHYMGQTRNPGTVENAAWNISFLFTLLTSKD